MVRRIKYIDTIARQVGHDVIFIGHDQTLIDPPFWLETPAARSIIDWLDQQAIQWGFCGPLANSGWFDTAYIYVDIVAEIDNPQYQMLCEFLDDTDGNCKWPCTNAWVLTFEDAVSRST